MSAPPLEIARDLERAAELRASGLSWPSVALQIHRPQEEIERWPHEFPDLWSDLFDAEQMAIAGDLASQCMGHNRVLLRSENEKIRIQAVMAGLRYHVAMRRLENSKRNAQRSRSTARTEVFTDEQLVIYANEILYQLNREPGQTLPAHGDRACT